MDGYRRSQVERYGRPGGAGIECGRLSREHAGRRFHTGAKVALTGYRVRVGWVPSHVSRLRLHCQEFLVRVPPSFLPPHLPAVSFLY